MRTPEERARLHSRLRPQVTCYYADSLDCIRSGSVAREQGIEICKVRLLESFIDVVNLFGRRLGTLYLTVAGMIAWPYVIVTSLIQGKMCEDDPAWLSPCFCSR